MSSLRSLLASVGRPLVMGILNLTPDSFSDGGLYFEAEAAARRARQMVDEGADILDVGACSTAPGKAPASAQEECDRLRRLLPSVMEAAGNTPVSIDTFRPEAAELALSLGAQIVNDESGAFSPETAALVKRYNADWVVMHVGGADSSHAAAYPAGVVAAVRAFFAEMQNAALAAGVPAERLCYDPGIGFGKTREDDLRLLASCGEFAAFSPLLIGVSRKRVVGVATGESEPENRLYGTVAAQAVAVYGGAAIIRAHDVRAALDAVRMAQAIRKVNEVWTKS
ncbi:MAG: dihydropteroate synthase [Clostridia bacterium]|nr:dihydropteroate synthase [Clostridia bacterium]